MNSNSSATSDDARHPSWRRLLGFLLALNLLSALALQFAPELHHELHDKHAHDHAHHDGTGAQGHECLITLLQTGSLELTSFAPAAGILLLILLFAQALPPLIFLSQVAYRLLPGRAPPAVA
ncbi:MAG: hypothetical protein IPK15_26190 [Verrucomicrobia bacterium]|nr:hypothetical protein [Verrucomicrobiota bacterium]